ncbi:Alpha/Beta hydrolase protein [Mycena metata]|uniref:Alpha/Beta hydrolase protein n=1 Tax=Mycena metata TaxID=1033252 RepID=A0AAD7NZ26_9AGAR|nr:Alpha/Beta hydrolase protein [Mycena metata]
MPVSTLSAAVHITPVVLRTFKQHTSKRLAAKRDGKHEEEAQDDILFDEAFHIVKAFIELGTKNRVESLQAFTNTHVPAPYWAAVASVCIPLQSCNASADILIDWFGPEELKAVVGGERWWQVRGLDGVDGEWITQKDYLSDAKVHPPGRKLSDDEQTILRMEKLDRVMLYVHGGGYFWGSINTHRYQLIRYARKIKGRVFAVNYRKAPQYPWPCPLQDVLAAYLYLIRPPPNAPHQAIPPSKIVLAGDSAGGGLCLSTLAILRDMGLPMPAGAVLISPWVDLTHSFPSVMQNTETDIIPQHGFLAKPSTLWPVDPLPTTDGRVGPATNDPPPDPGHADQLRPTKDRVKAEADDAADGEPNEASSSKSGSPSSGAELADEDDYDIDFWEPRAPKVQMNDPNSVPLELHAQIQLYATTEQLTHPLVSPVLQGSLGNLPPMYILAGNDEVLRDEIVYIAHRAAHPEKYPIRKGALRDARRQQENAERFTQPTKVHLQVFDDMCHVLTVFTFTESAKHAYRSIAAFVKHVTDHDEEELAQHPFPELNRPLTNDTFPPRAAEASRPNGDVQPKPAPKGSSGSDDAKTQVALDKAVEKVTETTSDTFETDIRMIRERVNIQGITRPMEPQEEMSVLRLKPSQIGIIKEAPTIKWLKGQEEWDKKYKRNAVKAIRQRQKHTENAKRLLNNAREQGLLLVSDVGPDLTPAVSASAHQTDGSIQEHRRWGPLDLEDERPPPTAIAKRLDTPDALALLKKHIYHTAPKTHRTIPKMKFVDAVRAAFDVNDDPINAPKQSVSEAQVRNNFVPMHGLKIWDVLVGYFMRKSQEKATNGKNAIVEVIAS